MKKSKLIEILKDMPEDTIVLRQNHASTGFFYEVESGDVSTVLVSSDDGFEYTKSSGGKPAFIIDDIKVK